MTKLYSSSRGGEGGLRDTSTSGSSPPQASSQIFLGAGEDCSLWPQCHRTPTSPTTGRPCLQEGRVTLALVHFFFFYTLTLARGGGGGGGYPTCLVNALRGITRLPRTTFLRHAWPVIMTVTSRLLERNYQIFELNYNRLNNIRYFLYTMIILEKLTRLMG